MTLTDYDIQRISSAIVDKLTSDEKFISMVSKCIDKKNKKLVGSSRAAEILGVTRKTVCEIAEHLGGIRGNGQSAHWVFPENTLVERYIRYKESGGQG